MKSTNEAGALLERLEKKYIKKLETQEHKRHSREIRKSLARMEGVSASYLSGDRAFEHHVVFD